MWHAHAIEQKVNAYDRVSVRKMILCNYQFIISRASVFSRNLIPSSFPFSPSTPGLLSFGTHKHPPLSWEFKCSLVKERMHVCIYVSFKHYIFLFFTQHFKLKAHTYIAFFTR